MVRILHLDVSLEKEKIQTTIGPGRLMDADLLCKYIDIDWIWCSFKEKKYGTVETQSDSQS